MILSIVDICNQCPPDMNCCTGISVDIPVILPFEIHNISKKIGLSISDFSVPTGGSLYLTKPSDNGCFFYKNIMCSIYGFRPVDCKLFPFDIRKNNDGEFVIVSYLKACPTKYNKKSLLDEAKKLLPPIMPYIEEYATISTPLLDSEEYNVDYVIPISLTNGRESPN